MKALMAFMTAVVVAILSNFGHARQPASKIAAHGVVYIADEIGGSISAIHLVPEAVAIVPAQISPHDVQADAVSVIEGHKRQSRKLMHATRRGEHG
jgi:hypothetical protein